MRNALLTRWGRGKTPGELLVNQMAEGEDRCGTPC